MEYFRSIEINIAEPLTESALDWLKQTKHVNYRGDKSFRLLLDTGKHINADLLDYYDRRGFFIKYAEIFYTAVSRESMIHSDSDPSEYSEPNSMGKINHINGGVDSLMHWYRPKVKKSFDPNTNKNKYVSYDITEVDLLFSAGLQGYNIVQVAPPHNITNHKTQRVCTSMTIRKKTDPDRMPSFQTLVDAFV